MTKLSFDTSVSSVKIGNAGEIPIDVTKFSPEVLSHVFNYGLKQILNDTRSAEKDSDKAMALVEKKLAALYAGTLRAGGERETDPVKAEAKKIATAKITAALKAKFKKEGKDWKEWVSSAQFNVLVKKLAEREDVMATAKANVEAAKALDVEDDLLDGLEMADESDKSDAT